MAKAKNKKKKVIRRGHRINLLSGLVLGAAAFLVLISAFAVQSPKDFTSSASGPHGKIGLNCRARRKVENIKIGGIEVSSTSSAGLVTIPAGSQKIEWESTDPAIQAYDVLITKKAASESALFTAYNSGISQDLAQRVAERGQGENITVEAIKVDDFQDGIDFDFENAQPTGFDYTIKFSPWVCGNRRKGQVKKIRVTVDPNAPTPAVSTTPTGSACTEDAKICPDGSAVGRTGPNCTFAPCPPTPTRRIECVRAPCP